MYFNLSMMISIMSTSCCSCLLGLISPHLNDNMLIVFNIIIINTRPRPAFGRLGLGRSSGGKTSGGVSKPRFAPSALSSALKQYILALLS